MFVCLPLDLSCDFPLFLWLSSYPVTFLLSCDFPIIMWLSSYPVTFLLSCDFPLISWLSSYPVTFLISCYIPIILWLFCFLVIHEKLTQLLFLITCQLYNELHNLLWYFSLVTMLTQATTMVAMMSLMITKTLEAIKWQDKWLWIDTLDNLLLWINKYSVQNLTLTLCILLLMQICSLCSDTCKCSIPILALLHSSQKNCMVILVWR